MGAYIPYHTDGEMIETSFGNRRGAWVDVDVADHSTNRAYEVTLNIENGDAVVQFSRQRIWRGSGSHLRSVKLPAKIEAAVLRAYDRYLKIGKEPVVGDYIEEGCRIIEIVDGLYLTAYDDPEERIVWLGGGAVVW